MEPSELTKMHNSLPSFVRAVMLVTLCGLIHACAPTTLPQRPPENYKGPIAEGPILRAEDYWIYRRPDGTRIKGGSGTLLAPVEFPLWVGRMWTYQSGALPIGQPQSSKAYRTPVEITCEATAFKTISVEAGSFEAFECQCECRLIAGAGIYEPGCGQWTVWYAPQAKNIVKIKTGSTATSVELLEYKVSDPKADGFYKSAMAYSKTGDYDRAIQDFNEAIRLNPNYAAAFNDRGNVYLAKKYYDRAIEDYDRGIRLNPSYAIPFYNRGLAYYNKKDNERALQDYDQAIRLDPKYAAAFNNRGNVYRDKRDYDRAIQDYDEAIRLDPNYVLALNNRGNAYRNKRDYDRAIADYEAAARIDPKLAQHKSMGYTFFYLGRMAQSADAMERRVTAAPQDMYAILWRYVLVAKDKGLQVASRELGENAAKLHEPRWPAPVIDFYLGKVDEKGMYAAAENPDPKKKGEQICEANFYAAEAKLLNGMTEAAIPLLRAAEKECPPTFYEAHGARAELKRLGY